MSFDRTARDSEMDRTSYSMWSDGWGQTVDAHEEPPISGPPVRAIDMERLFQEVAATRGQPGSELPSASELAFGSPESRAQPLAKRRNLPEFGSAGVLSSGATLHTNGPRLGEDTRSSTATQFEHATSPTDVAPTSATQYAGASRDGGGTAQKQTAAPSQTRNAAHADWRALGHTLELSAVQLKLASGHLADWKFNHYLGAAMHWVAKRRDVLAATPDKTLDAWAPFIAGQSAVLFEAGGELAEVTAAATRKNIRPDAPEAAPYRDVLEAYAVAIGEAHDSENPHARLAAARRARAQLPLELLEQSLRENRSLTIEMMTTMPNVKDVHGNHPVQSARDAAHTLDASSIELRQKYNATGSVDETALDALTSSAGEQIVIARTALMETKIGQLADAMQSSTEGVLAGNANFFNDDLRTIKHALYAIRPEVAAITSTMRREAIPEGPFPADHAEGQRMFAAARRRAVARANAALAKLAHDHQLDSLFKRAIAGIDDAQRNTRIARLVVDIALLIGISVVSTGIASAASGAVRGAICAEAAMDTAAFASRASLARGAGAVTGLATDVALQSVGQKLVDSHTSFGEAALTNLLTLGVLRPFHTAVSGLGQLDAETRGLWKVVAGGNVVLVETGKLTVETLVGAGASYVAKRILEGKAPPNAITATEWAMQGASIAVGKFVHGRMRSLSERWAQYGEEKIALVRRAREQQQLAEKLKKSGSTEDALNLLDEHQAIIKAEQALLADPAALARLHLDPQHIAVLRRGNSHTLAETQSQALGVIRLRFHGLEPMTSTGDVWSGTRSQINAIFADAGSAAKHVTLTGEGEWTARMGGQDVKFVEVSHWGVDAKDIKRVPQKGDDGHQYQYDAMHPGPLSDRSVYDPGDNGEILPAQNFYGGKYDEIVLSQDTELYRVGNAEQEWGRWFTDHPIKNEAHLRIDLAVQREWLDPGTGTTSAPARGPNELELWSYSILIPKGAKVYIGQVGSQGGVFMGGLGSGSQQYFIPNIRRLASTGAKVISKFRLKSRGRH